MTIYTVPLIKRFENWIFKKYFMIGSTVLFFSVLAFALSPKKPDYSIEESLSTMIPIFIFFGGGSIYSSFTKVWSVKLFHDGVT